MSTRSRAETVKASDRTNRDGAWLPDVESVTATPIGRLGPDGGVRRGAFIGWTWTARTGAAVRGWRVYARPLADDPEIDTDDGSPFDLVAQVGSDVFGASVFDYFDDGRRYEIVVVAVGLDCCVRRPPEYVGATSRLIYGAFVAEPVAAPPSNVRILRTSFDTFAIAWDAVETSGVPLYEVRHGGASFECAEILGRTRATLFDLGLFPPLGDKADPGYLYVAAVLPTGFTASAGKVAASAALTIGATAWFGNWIDDAAFLGSGSQVVQTAGEMRVADGYTSGTYNPAAVSPAISAKVFEFYPFVHVTIRNKFLTPRLAQFSPRSVTGSRRSPNMGRDAEAYPRDFVPRMAGVSPNAHFGAPSALTSYSPNSFSRPRPTNLAVLTPNEARFAPSSRAGWTTTPNGVLSTAGGGVSLLWRRKASGGGAFTAWSAAERATATVHTAEMQVVFSQPGGPGVEYRVNRIFGSFLDPSARFDSQLALVFTARFDAALAAATLPSHGVRHRPEGADPAFTRQSYSLSGDSTNRILDVSTATVADVANVVATMIRDFGSNAMPGP